MRRIFPLFLVLLLLFSVPVYAAEDETAGNIEPSVDDAALNGSEDEGVMDDVSASQETESPTENVIEISSEDAPVYFLETAETAETDSPALSSVSVYDLAPMADNADTSVSTTVYNMTFSDVEEGLADWEYSNGCFSVILTDAWFDHYFPGYSKSDVLSLLDSYPHSMTFNGDPYTEYSLDAVNGIAYISYIGDGVYSFISDAGFHLTMDVTSEIVSVPSADVSIVTTLKSLFGDYTPKTYNVTTYLSDGTVVQSTEIVSGIAGLDYEWLSSVALFSLVLYGLLRMIGGLLKQ